MPLARRTTTRDAGIADAPSDAYASARRAEGPLLRRGRGRLRTGQGERARGDVVKQLNEIGALFGLEWDAFHANWLIKTSPPFYPSL